MQQPHESPGTGADEGPRPGADTGARAGTGSAARKETAPGVAATRVLVVDDDPTVAEVVSGYLDRAGHLVDRARTVPPHSPGPPRTARTWWCST